MIYQACTGTRPRILVVLTVDTRARPLVGTQARLKLDAQLDMLSGQLVSPTNCGVVTKPTGRAN